MILVCRGDGVLPMEWQIIISPVAQKQLGAIKDTRVQQALENAIDSLEIDPDKRGKPLTGKLAGSFSIRVYAQRHRIIYKLQLSSKEVVVLALGLRKEGDRADIYSLVERLISKGFLLLLTLGVIIVAD
jgi:mRNA interferase RelE/StbE